MAIFKPDGFRLDWYGYLTNQVSHIGLGIGLAWGMSTAVYLLAGEFPIKWGAWFIILAFYSLYELGIQRWNGFDTVEDIVFVVVYGAGGAFVSFAEIEPGSPMLSINVLYVLPVLVVALVHLGLGVAWRAKVWRVAE